MSDTFYAEASDAGLESFSGTSFLAARAGDDVNVTQETTGAIDIHMTGDGGSTWELVAEAFFEFDTSLLAGRVVTAVEVALYTPVADYTGPTQTLEVRATDWAGGVPTGTDWVAGADVAAQTLLASASLPNGQAGGVVVTWVSEEAIKAYINTAGMTRLMLVSSLLADATDPDVSGNWTVGVGTSEQGDPALRPQLVITSYVPVTLEGNQPGASGTVTVETIPVLTGNQPAASGSLDIVGTLAATHPHRALPIQAGTARVTSPRPASGSIRTKRNGSL